MVIPRDETFDYTVVVPANGTQKSWPVQPSAANASLVGASPTIKIVEAGLPKDSTQSTASGFVLPRVLRSQIVITSSDAASDVTAAAFHVDREFTAPLAAGDTIRIARNHLGALAIAIVRGDHLVAAAGAITSIALGNVVARIPRQLIEAALDVFRPRDPDFAFREWPVEVEIDAARAVLFSGRRDLGEYCVFVDHGLVAGDSAADESLSI